MKKVLFSLLIIVVSLFSAKSATIHWLTFIDTTDSGVGKYDIKGRNALYSHFINPINSALKIKGYSSDIIDIYGSSLSPQRCKEEIQQLQTNAEDIIVFYYIGHGSRSPQDSSPFPQMCMGAPWEKNNMWIPLSWAHETLKAKNARLTLTVGMCCNAIQNISAKNAPTFSPCYGNASLTETEIENIQNLFLSQSGDLLVTSSSPGQCSYVCDQSGFDMYTTILLGVFEEVIGEEPVGINLDSFFGAVGTTVDNLCRGWSGRGVQRIGQSPIQKSNLKKATAVDDKKTPRPNPQKDNVKSTEESEGVSIANAQAVIELLTKYFDAIVDERYDSAVRSNLAENLTAIFTNTAQIVVKSQDGDIVVSRKTASYYLQHIATLRVLLKVIPIKYSHDGSRITTLEVKEVYKKSHLNERKLLK